MTVVRIPIPPTACANIKMGRALKLVFPPTAMKPREGLTWYSGWFYSAIACLCLFLLVFDCILLPDTRKKTIKTRKTSKDRIKPSEITIYPFLLVIFRRADCDGLFFFWDHRVRYNVGCSVILMLYGPITYLSLRWAGK